jgi:hypothetical protein
MREPSLDPLSTSHRHVTVIERASDLVPILILCVETHALTYNI